MLRDVLACVFARTAMRSPARYKTARLIAWMNEDGMYADLMVRGKFMHLISSALYAVTK